MTWYFWLVQFISTEPKEKGVESACLDGLVKTSRVVLFMCPALQWAPSISSSGSERYRPGRWCDTKRSSADALLGAHFSLLAMLNVIKLRTNCVPIKTYRGASFIIHTAADIHPRAVHPAERAHDLFIIMQRGAKKKKSTSTSKKRLLSFYIYIDRVLIMTSAWLFNLYSGAAMSLDAIIGSARV